MSIRLNTAEIKSRFGLNGEAQQFFTHTCRLHMDKFVPYANGDLRTLVEEGEDYVKYYAPYAHYLYEGILYVDPETGSSWAKKDATKVPTGKELEYHTAGTGDHWDNLMWSAEKNQVIEEMQDFINRR